MSLELLRDLCSSPLPRTVTSESAIDQLRILRAAGYIAAFLPAPGSASKEGRVLAVTRSGRSAVAVAGEPEAACAAASQY